MNDKIIQKSREGRMPLTGISTFMFSTHTLSWPMWFLQVLTWINLFLVWINFSRWGVLPWWPSGQRWHTQHASGLQAVLGSDACSLFPTPVKGVHHHLKSKIHKLHKRESATNTISPLTSLKSLFSMKIVAENGITWLPLATSAGKSGTLNSDWRIW